jgi:hypothetical protein
MADKHKAAAEVYHENILNAERVFAGKNTTVRYSPETFSMAMAVFQRSRCAYAELVSRDLSHPWPSISHLTQLRNVRRHGSGNNSAQYVDARETFGISSDHICHGELLVDECKIIGNLIFHSYNHTIEGMTDDQNDLDALTDILFDNEDRGDNASKNIAVSLNLWKFRQIGEGVHFSFICEHWYNNGSLNSQSMLKQFNCVLLNCELQGFQVHGLCCDAGKRCFI